jgi:hypothetical protein
MNKFFKKGDLLIIGVLLALVIVWFTVESILPSTANGYAKITVNGEEYGTFSLETPREFTITTEKGSNRVKIEDGKVCVTEASCKDGLCVRQGTVHRLGESVVCLPNGVVITVEKGENETVDFING